MHSKRHIPPLGMRIVKTGICVFFCLLLNYLFSPQVALYSSLAAITTMQATLESTKHTSAMELVGTALGGCAGIAILPLAQMIDIEWLYVFIMPLGMILVIYLCVAIRMPQAASLCGFVYIAVLVAPYDPTIDGNPYLPAVYRITDTAVGVVIALLVNRYIAPPRPKAMRNVHVPANTFSSIYNRVKPQLKGDEHLILIDTGLMDPDMQGSSAQKKASDFTVKGPQWDTVSIPIPMEFISEPVIHSAYISLDYNVVLFQLTPTHGYVDLPAAAYPATVVWHTTQSSSKETYGIMHHRRSRSHSSPGHVRTFRQADSGGTGNLRGPHESSDRYNTNSARGTAGHQNDY